MGSRHTDREFEQELEGLRQRILRMGGRVEEMMSRAVTALGQGRPEDARATILLDRQVNQDELEVDEVCLRLLARWQPMASDLRFILFSVKVVTDLERIGDLAVNICERAVDLGEASPADLAPELPAIARIVSAMLSGAIEAFVDRDAEKARAVISRDDEVDELYHIIFGRQVARMSTDPGIADRHISVLNVARYLERAGDHCTNLCEQVIFLVRGQDVRHQGKRVH